LVHTPTCLVLKRSARSVCPLAYPWAYRIYQKSLSAVSPCRKSLAPASLSTDGARGCWLNMGA
jgi:hypothetical protein